MKPLALPALVLFALTQSATARGEDVVAARGRFKAFVEAYCIDCHGPDVQKAGLRLDVLGADLADEADFSKWVRVHDKVAAGEMPPRNGGPLPMPEAESFTKWLHGELHAASLVQQQSQGRVPLRRLNGTEYENTIRELVGTQVRVKELMPEEKSVAGFDNVSSALDFSATHLLLYQEAAEKAVRSAVPMHPPIPFQERRTGQRLRRERAELQADSRSKLQAGGRQPRHLQQAAALWTVLNQPYIRSGDVPRADVGVGGGEERKPMPVGFFILENTGRDDPVLLDCRDVRHGEPQIIELEVELGRRQAFVVNLLTQWDIRDFKRPLAEYTGPGLKLDWLEIEGPIGPFPPRELRAAFRWRAAQGPLRGEGGARGCSSPVNIASRRTPENWLNDPLEPASADPPADAERLIRAFLPRAFRRPVPEELTKFYVARVQQKLDEKYSFYDAMIYGYKAILSSPHFLCSSEPGPEARRLRRRQSPGRTSSGPARRTMSCSPPPREGELTKPDELRAQVERMLEDPRAHRFTENFTGQWLDLRKINATSPTRSCTASSTACCSGRCRARRSCSSRRS